MAYPFSKPLASPVGDKRLCEYRQATGEIQRWTGEAIRTGKSARAHGSSWALSTVGLTPHPPIDTAALRVGFQRIVDPQPGDREPRPFCFLEGGMTLDLVHRYLASAGLSLPTCGSNVGQTLAGAISTGTHGSAFRFGSMQDCVVGIHLVVGPDRHVYLERWSSPFSQQEFADSLGAELIRDDVLFNAALVSFGSFGVIQGLMIEPRKLFLLHAYRRRMPYDAALGAAVGSLDFSRLEMPNDRNSEKLHHFAAAFNPNRGTPPHSAFVDLMFEGEVPDQYSPPPIDELATGPSLGTFEAVDKVLSTSSKRFPIEQQFEDHYQAAVLGDLFRGEVARSRSFSVDMGVPLDHSLDALNIAFDTYHRFDRPISMLFACRYVTRTEALLGFTRFDPTCVLEVDARNTPVAKRFVRTLWADLNRANIPFTLHWGKWMGFLSPRRVRNMYGEACDQWIASRQALLSDPAVRRVFTNPFLQRVGLT